MLVQRKENAMRIEVDPIVLLAVSGVAVVAFAVYQSVKQAKQLRKNK